MTICGKKQTYLSKSIARRVSKNHPNGKWLNIYYCDEHTGYHLGRDMKGILRRAHREGSI